MIYTVCLNPAVDLYLSFDKFKEGEQNFPHSDNKLAGGKGINVSMLLKNFGIKSTCLGFVGGFTGDFICDTLNKLNIKSDFIKLDEDTRINIKINNDGLETEIAGIAPQVSKEKYNELLSLIKNKIKAGDVLVLSGSVPKSVSKEVYAEIISLVGSDVKIILDASGEALKNGLAKKVHLVKPNRYELEEFFGRKIVTEEELILAGRELQKLGAENVIISLGKDGSVMLTKDKIYFSGVPDGKLISSVGAGDSMVAGYIYGLINNLSEEETYKFAVASGSATVYSVGLTTLDTAKKLLNKFTIKNFK